MADRPLDPAAIGQAVVGAAVNNSATQGTAGALGQVGQSLGGQLAGKALGGAAGRALGGALGFMNGMLFGRQDPDLAFHYALEIDGITSASFKECSGVEWEMEVVNLRSGGNNIHEHHLMGPGKFKPLEIKRGFMGGNGEFYHWMKGCVDPFSKSAVKRVTVSLVIFNDEMWEVGRFNFYNCFISKWSGPSMDASNADIAFESMTIQYDWFEFTPGGFLAGKIQEKAGAAFGVIKGALGF
jgi:phage tail-like protein